MSILWPPWISEVQLSSYSSSQFIGHGFLFDPPEAHTTLAGVSVYTPFMALELLAVVLFFSGLIWCSERTGVLDHMGGVIVSVCSVIIRGFATIYGGHWNELKRVRWRLVMLVIAGVVAALAGVQLAGYVISKLIAE
ncbi:MAG: hypothetical protein DWP92_10120 [Armatimonadetes bacterium]|nr:MAG: hypothetical protein DWP92_10120 [Armatimonadota bacterium]